MKYIYFIFLQYLFMVTFLVNLSAQDKNYRGMEKVHGVWLHPGYFGTEKDVAITKIKSTLDEVRRYEISLMTKIVRLYSVDWIHQDYIRFPSEPEENYYSFDTQRRNYFKNYSVEDPLFIKTADAGNILWNEWIQWNTQHINNFLRQLRDSLRIFNHKVKVSAAVFPDTDNANVLIVQDWKYWTDENLVDMLCQIF